MKAIRPLTGTGYSVGPGELFSVPEDVAEELAMGGNAYYVFDALPTYEVAREPSLIAKPIEAPGVRTGTRTRRAR